MGFLFYSSFAINFLGLVLALWLGLYLVTRNTRYLIAWLHFMFPFWPEAAPLGNPNNWLLGWAVAPSIA